MLWIWQKLIILHLFQASYGSKDANDVAKVKAVYDELKIPKMSTKSATCLVE
jgi:hypothetical protein